MSERKRDDFNADVKRNLAARVAYRCSNPSCRATTSGPQADATKAVNIGVAAHITAASRGGPRFREELTPTERASADNAIWLCQNCAKLIDSDTARFSSELILAWKANAEQWALSHIGRTTSDESLDQPFVEHTLDLLTEYDDSWVTPWFSQTEAPPGFFSRTSAPDLSRRVSTRDLLQSAEESVLVLLGSGGAGKTTALQALTREAAALRIADKRRPIPVLLELRYLRTSLQELVATRLGAREHALGAELQQFLLLVDGLNELPPKRRIALLGEIESLSKNLKTKFILSSRASFADHPVELRSHAMFYRVLPWSWRDLRGFAERQIHSHRVELFLASFARLLRTLTARDAGLPIVPILAARAFLRSETARTSVYDLAVNWAHACADRFDAIKVTLGSPLDTLPRETVLSLAACFAYCLQVERGLKAATPDELPALMKDALAELRLAGAIGAHSLDDVAAVAVLTHAGFASRGQERALEIEHEVLGDFLASQRIAAVPERRDSLPVDIDSAMVWEFVARQLDEKHRAELVTRALSSSIALAARCVSTTMPEAEAIAANALQQIKEGSPLRRSIAIDALEGLEKIPCLDDLRVISQTERDPDRRWAASVVLSHAGDHDHLRTTLQEAEKMASGPGTASGGEIALWWKGPPDVLLAIAREQIQGGNVLLCLSLETVARYGGEHDCDIVLNVVRRSQHFKSVLRCFEVVSILRPTQLPQAASIARERFGEHARRMDMENDLSYFGLGDFDYLLEVAGQKFEKNRDALAAGDALGRMDLNERQRYQVLRKFASIRREIAQSAWRLVSCCRLKLPFRAVARALVSPEEAEVRGVSGYLCLEGKHFSANDARELFQSALPRMVAGAITYRNMVEFLATSGCVEEAAEHVDLELRSLRVDITELLRIPPRGADDEATPRELELRYDVETRLARWLTPALACRTYLAADGFLAFLHMGRLRRAGADEMERCVAILASLPSTSIDGELQLIRKPEDRAWALAQIAPLGETETRVRLLCEILLQVEEHPMCIHHCWSASTEMWSATLATAWIGCLNIRYHYRDDLAARLPQQIESLLELQLTKDDLATIDRHLTSPASEMARRSLENLRELILYYYKIPIPH